MRQGDLLLIRQSDLPLVDKCDLPLVRRGDLTLVHESDLPLIRQSDIPLSRQSDLPLMREGDLPLIRQSEYVNIYLRSQMCINKLTGPSISPINYQKNWQSSRLTILLTIIWCVYGGGGFRQKVSINLNT